MNETDLERVVARVSKAMHVLAIPFHVTGGVAASNYGRPRMTLDLDLVVRFDDEATLNALIHSLRDEFFIDAESVHSSIRSNQMFQALDNETYITIDFHVGERIPGELERSVPTEIFPGITVPFASIEDSLLSKLIWYSMGSERSWQDALYIVHRQRRKLDVQLLTQLAESLDLSRELSRLLDAGERDL